MKNKIKSSFDQAFHKAAVVPESSKSIKPKVVAAPAVKVIAAPQPKVIAPPVKNVEQAKPKHVKFVDNDTRIEELKQQSKDLARPYLGKFDHLLKSNQPKKPK